MYVWIQFIPFAPGITVQWRYLKGFAKSNPTFTISNPTITKSNPRFVYVARVRRFSDSLVIHIEIKIMHYEAHIPLLGQTSAPSFGAGFGQ
jgi:hypothetical protein